MTGSYVEHVGLETGGGEEYSGGLGGFGVKPGGFECGDDLACVGAEERLGDDAVVHDEHKTEWLGVWLWDDGVFGVHSASSCCWSSVAF